MEFLNYPFQTRMKQFEKELQACVFKCNLNIIQIKHFQNALI